MRDPREGVTADGLIVTGVDRRAVPTTFEPVLAAVRERLSVWPAATSYLYGSVATGQARVGRSDVDVLTVGLPVEQATAIGLELTDRFAGLCREVAVAPAHPDDLQGDDDPAYGLRVFVRHYCVRLGGPDRSPGQECFPADARAARGFNGDIDRHLGRWRAAPAERDPVELGRRLARKTLLATAGLVSVLESTWTTDRELAVHHYGTHRPDLTGELGTLGAWCTGESSADRRSVHAVLAHGGVVQQVVDDFRVLVGLWPGPP